MDSSFTEHVLERARERQRKLQESSNSGHCTPLREANLILERAQKVSTSLSKSNLDDPKYRKEVVSDLHSNSETASLVDSTPKENCSAGGVQRIVRQNSATKIFSNLPGSPRPQFKTLSIEKDNFNMEIKLISSENVRVEVEIQESDGSDCEGKNDGKSTHVMETPGLREQAKSRLKKLGNLYAGGEDANISSPIQRTEVTFLSEMQTPLQPVDSIKSTRVISKNDKLRGLSKLADLAQNISYWEDDVPQTKKVHNSTNKEDIKGTIKKSWKSPAPQPPITNHHPSKIVRSKQQAPKPPVTSSSLCSKTGISSSRNVNLNDSTVAKEVSPEQLKWDQAVLDTLESQGFTRTTSNSRLVYNYNASQESATTKQSPQHFNNKADETNLCENKVSVCNLEITKIPEESKREQQLEDVISIKKFVPLNVVLEQQKVTPRSPTKASTRSAVIANKAAIFESSPTKPSKDPAVMSIAEKKAMFERNKGAALLPKSAFGMATKNVSSANVVRPAYLRVDDAPTDNKMASSGIIKSAVNKTFVPKPVHSEDGSVNSPIKAAFAEAGGIASKIAALINNKNTICQEQIESSVREQRQKEMQVLMNRFNRNKDLDVCGTRSIESDQESEGEDATETTSMISTKPAKIITSVESSNPLVTIPLHPSGEKRKSCEKENKKSNSPQVTAVLEDVKRIKVTQPKEGKLYPCLSDIETATETELTTTPSPNNRDSKTCFRKSRSMFDPICKPVPKMNSFGESFCSEESGADTSFGRDILQAVYKNQTPQQRTVYDESTTSDMSDILDDMDDYLEEAMADEISSCSNGPTPPKVGKVTTPLNNTRPSESFHYKNFSPHVNSQNLRSPMKVSTPPKQSIDLPTHVIDGEDILPLTHTVSFYRRQQTQVKTPVRQISREVITEETDDNVRDNNAELVSKKIRDLLDEVNIQQMIISQTSRALNLCNSTPEFMGSTEQVEAEKVLLLATHRRQACLHEVQRLRVEGTLRPQGQRSQNVHLEKGSLTLSNITLPLKKEYVRALAAAGGKGHHVVCLIKCGEQVLTTHLVSTVASSSKNTDQELHVPGTVCLANIFGDSTVTFEVYCLQAQEEVLPHEVKYHINKKCGSKLTPRKTKQESRMVGPPKESPGGPNAVRTSTFALMGYIVFSVQAVNKKHWTLNKAPSMSPLEGSVEMKVSCELAASVEHRGFLTMFEDVSGFGAWHRRWCLLKGDTLSYWKYPDEEKRKAPIDSIDLTSSITDQVGPVSRDICARLHTILIERERKVEAHDKDSLVIVRKGDKTIIRHLLSADTKEERIEWCNEFNKALMALRMWGKHN